MENRVNETVEALKQRINAGDSEIVADSGETARSAGIVYLPVNELYPHPDNPRKDVGDVSELAESIKAKGVMQNLTVVRGHYENGSHEAVPGGYTVIIGHRRRAGSIEAGLEFVPCAIVDMSYEEQIMTMTVENVQRVDLTAYEQAGAFQLMLDLGATVDSISERTGFSRKTVKHRLEMAKLNAKTLKEVSERQITMADFEKLAQIKSIKTRNEVLKQIGTYNFDSSVARAVKKERFEEKLPAVIEALKALGAKEMKGNEKYSGKYEYLERIIVTEERKKDKPIIPKKYHKEELFYCVDDWSYDVSIYKKRPRAEAVKRSKAEIEREKDIGERKKRLKAMTELAKELRGNFAKGLVMNSKNREKILLGAAGVLSASAVSYMVTTHTRQVLEFVGKEVSDKYGENEKLYWAALESDPNRMIPALIYLSFENDSKASYYREVYNGSPEHKENVWLNTLYDWLVSLGYEMSDEEIALRDGSHEVFKKEGKEA